MNSTQEDCYYYLETGVPFEEARIRAACMKCKNENKIPGKPMYWAGREKGYGDYDLYCSICKHPIYLRETNEQNDTTTI